MAILLDQAFNAHAAGDLSRAQQLYRQILASQPNQPDSLQGLGIIASTLGDHPNAIELFLQAVKCSPKSSAIHTNFALVLLSANRVQDAIAMGQQAIRLAPNSEQSLFNLASIFEQAHFWSEAITGYQNLLRLFPENVEAVANLASLLFQQKQYEASLLLLKNARQNHPNHPEILFCLGKALHSVGQFDEALEALQRAMQARPTWELALNQIGIVHLARGDCLAAIESFKRVIAFSKQNVHAWYNLGIALRNARRPSEAVLAFQGAIAIDQNNAEAYYQLGSLFIERGEINAGIQAYESALAICPGFGLGDYLHQLQYLCQWGNLTSLTEQVLKQVDSLGSTESIDRVSPFTLVSLPRETSLAQLKICAEHWAKTFPSAKAQKTSFRVPRHHAGDRRLRIGDLSADFRIHAVAFHLPELFSSQDRSTFEVFAFSLAPATESDIRSRIVQAVDHFIDIHLLDHAAAAKRIADEEIDILVDLQGYTQLSRPEILTLRPAPIQVSYLGYPGTMGASLLITHLVTNTLFDKKTRSFIRKQSRIFRSAIKLMTAIS
jgi:protein O-GlcNAc transferase